MTADEALKLSIYKWNVESDTWVGVTREDINDHEWSDHMVGYSGWDRWRCSKCSIVLEANWKVCCYFYGTVASCVGNLMIKACE